MSPPSNAGWSPCSEPIAVSSPSDNGALSPRRCPGPLTCVFRRCEEASLPGDLFRPGKCGTWLHQAKRVLPQGVGSVASRRGGFGNIASGSHRRVIARSSDVEGGTRSCSATSDTRELARRCEAVTGDCGGRLRRSALPRGAAGLQNAPRWEKRWRDRRHCRGCERHDPGAEPDREAAGPGSTCSCPTSQFTLVAGVARTASCNRCADPRTMPRGSHDAA
jgi:hypothetical protein